MSDRECDDDVPRKRYKLWKNDSTKSVSLSTLNRWEKNQQLLENSASFHNADVHPIAVDEHLQDNDDLRDANSSDGSSVSEANSNESGLFDSSDHDDKIDSDGDNSVNELENDVDDNQSSNAETDDENDVIQRLLLYENSPTTVDESVVDVLEMYLNHNWSKSSLEKLLEVLQKFLPKSNNFPRTVYKLFQYVTRLVPSFIARKHYYCEQCSAYIGIVEACKECFACHADEKNISFFFEIDVVEQIKSLFEKQDLASKLKSHSRNLGDPINDIVDGTEYRRVNSREDRADFDLTLILNTDGLSLVKSSKSHFWPVMFSIAELPEYMRDSFIVIIGLWYSKKSKPDMNLFLKPFCSKLKECFSEGIRWVHPHTSEIIISKIVAPLIVADAPARAQVQNVLNYNGVYGCNLCEIKMERSEKIPGERVYRYYPFDNGTSKLRVGRRMKKQAQKVQLRELSHLKGVKGPAAIAELPLIDLGTCLLPEYMHSGLLGIGKQYLNLWMTVTGAWNIKRHSHEIDGFLLQIRPPQFFKRGPRLITEHNLYKASEALHWILFYSLPALVDYLPEQYLQHWMLFVKALFLLLKDKITDSDLDTAEIALKLFVKKIETLYGSQHLTYNSHQMLHLVLSVRRWGPLWSNSAFPFENFNGYLANLTHGTKHFGQEIINKLKIAQGVQLLKSQIALSKVKIAREKKIFIVGAGVKKALTDAEIRLMEQNNLDSENILTYVRASINNVDFSSARYKITKTNSHNVKIDFTNNSIAYGSIQFFFEVEQVLHMILKVFTIQHVKMFRTVGERVFVITHILPIEESQKLILVKINEVKSICHVIRVGDYICRRPNSMNIVY